MKKYEYNDLNDILIIRIDELLNFNRSYNCKYMVELRSKERWIQCAIADGQRKEGLSQQIREYLYIYMWLPERSTGEKICRISIIWRIVIETKRWNWSYFSSYKFWVPVLHGETLGWSSREAEGDDEEDDGAYIDDEDDAGSRKKVNGKQFVGNELFLPWNALAVLRVPLPGLSARTSSKMITHVSLPTCLLRAIMSSAGNIIYSLGLEQTFESVATAFFVTAEPTVSERNPWSYMPHDCELFILRTENALSVSMSLCIIFDAHVRDTIWWVWMTSFLTLWKQECLGLSNKRCHTRRQIYRFQTQQEAVQRT